MKTVFVLDPKNLPTLSSSQKEKLDTPEASLPEEENPLLSPEDFKKISQAGLVRHIRKELRLTQNEFSKLFHIKASRLRDWEQGRRTPDEAIMAYLQVIRAFPEVVKEVLSS